MSKEYVRVTALKRMILPRVVVWTAAFGRKVKLGSPWSFGTTTSSAL